MVSRSRVVAKVAVGLWRDGWRHKRPIGREQAALAYAPDFEVDDVIDAVEAAATADKCPIYTDFEGGNNWPPCWAIADDPDWVREFVSSIDDDLLPYDLR